MDDPSCSLRNCNKTVQGGKGGGKRWLHSLNPKAIWAQCKSQTQGTPGAHLQLCPLKAPNLWNQSDSCTQHLLGGGQNIFRRDKMAFLLSLTRAIRLSQSASSKVFQLLLPCISPHPEDNGNSWEEQLGHVRPTASCSHIATFNAVSNWPGCLRKQRQHWGMSREGASTPECLRPPRAAADNAVVLLSLC